MSQVFDSILDDNYDTFLVVLIRLSVEVVFRATFVWQAVTSPEKEESLSEKKACHENASKVGKSFFHQRD